MIVMDGERELMEMRVMMGVFRSRLKYEGKLKFQVNPRECDKNYGKFE
jgi:hypothetical protein